MKLLTNPFTNNPKLMTNPAAQRNLDTLIRLAIAEDLEGGDLATRAIIPQTTQATALISAKADGVISGVEVARQVIDTMGQNTFTPLVQDGDRIAKGQRLIQIEGRYDLLLSAERTMLNFLQRMSGIATRTAQIVSLLQGTKCRLLDTRKTAPGHRFTDKLAVRHGGGVNHRMGLYDMAMLKDNHLKAAGGVIPAVQAARRVLPISVKIEVETATLEQVTEALQAGADIIMLDNMSHEMMRRAVAMIDGRVPVEASGNITDANAAQVAATGVDYISIGALTHSVTALDMSMNFVLK